MKSKQNSEGTNIPMTLVIHGEKGSRHSKYRKEIKLRYFWLTCILVAIAFLIGYLFNRYHNYVVTRLNVSNFLSTLLVIIS